MEVGPILKKNDGLTAKSQNNQRFSKLTTRTAKLKVLKPKRIDQGPMFIKLITSVINEFS